MFRACRVVPPIVLLPGLLTHRHAVAAIGQRDRPRGIGADEVPLDKVAAPFVKTTIPPCVKRLITSPRTVLLPAGRLNP